MCCMLFWLVSVTIGLTLYGRVLLNQYIRHAFDTAEGVSNSVMRGADSATLSKEVMEIYNSLSDEERLKNGTDEYRDYYSQIDMSKGGAYNVLVHMLDAYTRDLDEINLIYLAMYDQKNASLVYIVDPETEDPLMPGDWEKVDRAEAKRFLNWDGKGPLYYINNTESYGWLCTAGVPIRDLKDRQGPVLAFVLVDVKINTVISGILDYAVKITLALLIVSALIMLAIMKHIGRTIVEPINAIAEAAEKYVKEKHESSSPEGVFTALSINTGDELENLSNVMADMEKDLSVYVENITDMTAKEERVRAEIDMAARIQKSALPDEFPAFPDRQEFDIYAVMEAAKKVGGDFYDFFLIDKEHLCIAIADVSGKGIPAALFMMSSKIILDNNASLGKTPAEILTASNNAICLNNELTMFVSVWLGILDLKTGVLTFSNAGHEPAAVCHKEGDFTLVEAEHNPAMGIIKGASYTDMTAELTHGDKLFIYTDGVTEAADSNRKFFGKNRMIDALNDLKNEEPRSVVEGVNERIRSFTKGAEQFDDITMLCITYR